MELKFFCPYWGSEGLPFEKFIKNVKAAGFDGVEMSFPIDLIKRNELVSMIRSNHLEIIGQHWETVDQDFKQHKINFERRLRNLASVDPLFINSQTGKDYYSFAQNIELIELADSVMKETGITIVHETHRGKFSYASHCTHDYLKKLPSLQLCLDISHWCCVAESLLDDQQEAVEAALERTFHIHARVGHSEGPQIMDPRCDEHADVVQKHLSWWMRVINKRNIKGTNSFSITPEFGPPPYLHVHPHTQLPMYSQWDVNVYMMNAIKKSYFINERSYTYE
jgi:sugar phosphate isomerase/epimerase